MATKRTSVARFVGADFCTLIVRSHGPTYRKKRLPTVESDLWKYYALTTHQWFYDKMISHRKHSFQVEKSPQFRQFLAPSLWLRSGICSRYLFLGAADPTPTHVPSGVPEKNGRCRFLDLWTGPFLERSLPLDQGKCKRASSWTKGEKVILWVNLGANVFTRRSRSKAWHKFEVHNMDT